MNKTTIDWKRTHANGWYYNYTENGQMVLGFTEGRFSSTEISPLFWNLPVKELKQTHSADILFSSQIKAGDVGDGIILDGRDVIAVIKTADCTPLFFFDDSYTLGGIIHVGWRGLQKGIEKVLLERLRERGIGLDGFQFILGPAIGQECYEVGTDVYDEFAIHWYRDDIFGPSAVSGKYQLDVKKGIGLSLEKEGIQRERIIDTGICTFCNERRFPSYRRDNKTADRICSFLLFKNG